MQDIHFYDLGSIDVSEEGSGIRLELSNDVVIDLDESDTTTLLKGIIDIKGVKFVYESLDSDVGQGLYEWLVEDFGNEQKIDL